MTGSASADFPRARFVALVSFAAGIGILVVSIGAMTLLAALKKAPPHAEIKERHLPVAVARAEKEDVQVLISGFGLIITRPRTLNLKALMTILVSIAVY